MDDAPLKNIVLGNQNVTVVYEQLLLERISRDALRAIEIPGEAPALIDIPAEAIALLFQKSALQVSFANRRMFVTSVGGMDSAEECELVAGVATQASEAIRDGSSVVAFGFNYRISFSLDDVKSARPFLRDRFVANREKIEATADAPLVGADVQLTFHDGPAERGIRIGGSSNDPAIFDAHVNVHFSIAKLPGRQILADGLHTERIRSMGLLKRLLSD